MFKSIREYENLHIALWLLKDTCWIMGWKTAGVVMVVPTLLVAVHIAWRSRGDVADLLHNLAVALWISANGIWMIGEFYCDDCMRPYAIIPFSAGMLIVLYYYLFLFPGRNKNRQTH